MAKKVTKKVTKKRVKKNVQHGQAHIQSSFLGKCWRNGLQRLQKIYSICSTDGS